MAGAAHCSALLLWRHQADKVPARIDGCTAPHPTELSDVSLPVVFFSSFAIKILFIAGAGAGFTVTPGSRWLGASPQVQGGMEARLGWFWCR